MKVNIVRRTHRLVFNCLRSFSIVSTSYEHSVDKVVQAAIDAGYQAEIHKVKTEDGCDLKLHRLLPAINSKLKGTTFLMHGLFRNSYDFLATGPNVSLAYFLSDNGYDVWLGNARGSDYNENEDNKIHSKDFWNFSFHEIGLYDLPAMINYMLDRTSQTKTFYIGHSQGACSLLALLSSQSSYNDKIIQAHLMAPAVFMKHSTSPLLVTPDFVAVLIASFFDKIDLSKLFKMSNELCNFGGNSRESSVALYEKVTCWLVGTNKKGLQISDKALMSFYYDMSSTVSVKQLVHFLQLHKSGKFQMFDYESKNLKFYYRQTPPEYKLRNVTAPVYLYSASEDSLILPKDVERLKVLLPNAKCHISVDDWNHLDVMLGRDSRSILYEKILESMNATAYT